MNIWLCKNALLKNAALIHKPLLRNNGNNSYEK